MLEEEEGLEEGLREGLKEGGEEEKLNNNNIIIPKEIPLEKILFQDESLLFVQPLPLLFRFRSLGVILCLIASFLFIIIDIMILILARTPLGMVLASLPLPLIILPLQYVFHRVSGSQFQLITNYRVMQCTVKWRTYYVRSLTFHVIGGIMKKDKTTIEFLIKDFRNNPLQKRKGDLKSMVFRAINRPAEVERIVHQQINNNADSPSLSSLLSPPHDPMSLLPSRYHVLLPELGIDPTEKSVQWVSNLSFFNAHSSVFLNAILMEGWVGTILFSPLLVDGKILEHYLGLVIILMTFIPCFMFLFNFLLRVDLIDSSGIAFFSVGVKVCGYGPRVDTLDYMASFPHTCEINKYDGSGVITFDNVPPKGLAMLKWPDVLLREELIFRQHCLSFDNVPDPVSHY